MDYLSISYTRDWKMRNFDGALQQLIPFSKNHLRSGLFSGGDPTAYACELAFSDYTIGKIYQDAGNKPESQKHYRAFLDRFKNSDPGIPEKEDAQKRLLELN